MPSTTNNPSRSVSPKELIMKYYDLLMNTVDKFSQETLAKYTEDKEIILGDKRVFSFTESQELEETYDQIGWSDEPGDMFTKRCKEVLQSRVETTYKHEYEIDAKLLNQPMIDEAKTIGVHAYVRWMRDEMIGELRKVMHETLLYYDAIGRNQVDDDDENKQSSHQDQNNNDNSPVLKKIFGHKFAFLICLDKLKTELGLFSVNNRSPFNVYLVVLDDFYFDYDMLCFFGNFGTKRFKGSFISHFGYSDFEVDLDLTALTSKLLPVHMTLNYLWDWFKQLKFGRHVIHINKQQLKSVDSMNFFYFRTHASKAMIKHDPLLFNDFDDFSNVKNVVITLTNTFDLQPAGDIFCLSGLANIESLQVRYSRFHPTCLANLTSLRQLRICGGSLKGLSSDDFKSLPNLDLLLLEDVKGNDQIDFYELHALRTLIVYKVQSYNFLYRLPDDLHMLRLESFSVYHLQNLKHANLKVLDFSICRLYEFDTKWLSRLTGLRHLRIRKSNLKTIKLNYSFLANLETLSLERNNIDKIDLSKLVNLKSLDLSYNRKLESHRNMFTSQADSLEELNLSAVAFSTNKVREASLGQLKQLRVLNLSKNTIRKFEPKMFIGLSNLRELKIKGNPVDKLEPSLAVKIFPKIEYIGYDDSDEEYETD